MVIDGRLLATPAGGESMSVEGRAEAELRTAAARAAAAVAPSRSADGRADARAEGATDGGMTAVWENGFRCHFMVGRSGAFCSSVFSFYLFSFVFFFVGYFGFVVFSPVAVCEDIECRCVRRQGQDAIVSR